MAKAKANTKTESKTTANKLPRYRVVQDKFDFALDKTINQLAEEGYRVVDFRACTVKDENEDRSEVTVLMQLGK